MVGRFSVGRLSRDMDACRASCTASRLTLKVRRLCKGALSAHNDDAKKDRDLFRELDASRIFANQIVTLSCGVCVVSAAAGEPGQQKEREI